MELLDKEQLIYVKGGAGLNSSMLNALIRTVSTLFTLGQAVGSAIRRGTTRKYC